jgi:Rod binding domain-containing protein
MRSPAIGFGPTPAPALASSGISPAVAARARATAQDFEAVFLTSMLGQMMNNVGEGPFSGGQAAKTWRSMLTDEYARNVARSGGVGIADSVYRQLIAQQEARVK